MSKRERSQSPDISRKRLNTTRIMRASTSPTPSLSAKTALEPHRSPSARSSPASRSSRSTTASTENIEQSSPTHREASPQRSQLVAASDTDDADINNSMKARPRIAPKLSTHFQIASTTAFEKSSNRFESAPMSATGLPSPTSIRAFACSSLSPDLKQSKDVLPVCSFGETVIRTDLTIPPKQWRLQSLVLAQHSAWFERSIRRQLIISHKQAGDHMFVITEADGQVRLLAQDVNEDVWPTSRVIEDERRSKPGIKAEDKIDIAIHKNIVSIYDQIFKAFSSIPPHISATDIQSATTEAEQLIKVAQNLECTHLISAHLGNALLQHRQALYKAILADPPRYLLLSLALENDFIYTDSLIHIIGASPCWPWPTARTALPTPIAQLIAQKSRDLTTEVLLVERELLLLTIVTSRGVPFAPEPSSQFDTWFAIQLFRDTIASVLREHDKGRPSLKRGTLFRKIRQGGSAYMASEEVRKMVRRVMPSAVEELDENLEILKEKASEIVSDLARNEGSLDVGEGKVGWLTCVKIGRGDIPWRGGGQ